jgi:imidazole glycerol-phosphate synthase subunit HisH
MYIAIINYNMGNIKSVENALKKIGASVKVTSSPLIVKNAASVILPGVGAYRDAVKNLSELGLYECTTDAIKSGKPFLGICIGLQLMFEYSMEGGKSPGFGIFSGTVRKIPAGVKIPHMGWNRLCIRKRDSRLLKGINDGESFYFVHSYYADSNQDDIISSTAEYGIDIVSSIEKDNVFGLQFHPEKSSTMGLNILKNFMEISRL